MASEEGRSSASNFQICRPCQVLAPRRSGLLAQVTPRPVALLRPTLFTLSLPGSNLKIRRLTFHNPGLFSSSLLDTDLRKMPRQN
jgi:hypothetical protein